MTKKETQKFNSIETSKTFCENNGRSKQSHRITKRKKMYELTEVFENSNYRVTRSRK